MKPPDFKYFDGIVIVRNTIQYEPTAEQVLDALKESRIPAISIGSELPQIKYIGVLNYEAQHQVVVEHLIRNYVILQDRPLIRRRGNADVLLWIQSGKMHKGRSQTGYGSDMGRREWKKGGRYIS